jgi:hypothetical protein
MVIRAKTRAGQERGCDCFDDRLAARDEIALGDVAAAAGSPPEVAGPPELGGPSEVRPHPEVTAQARTSASTQPSIWPTASRLIMPLCFQIVTLPIPQIITC